MERSLLGLIILITLLFSINTSAYPQTVDLDGHAFLEFQNTHENIKIEFERIAPSYLFDSTFTASSGYYYKELEAGIYTIRFSKQDYLDVQLQATAYYEDSTLNDQALEANGLSGELSGTLLAYTYKVGEDISIPFGETLVIEPGAVLKFKEDVKFEIFGKLIANGTSEDSIRFTHYYDSLSWKGIDFKENSSELSSLKYCIVEYSNDRGISVYKCSPSIQNSLVRYNTHNTNTNGQQEHLGGGAGICLKYSNSILKNIIVRDNSGETLGCGIYCSDGSPHISNSLIINNINPKTMYGMRPGGGIQCSYNVELTIENSVICYNLNSLGGGICVGPGIASYHPTATIVNCIIYENTAHGEYSHGGGVATLNLASSSIINSLLWNNEGENYYGNDPWLGINVTVNNNSDSCDAYGNIQMDPYFESPSSGDFSISEESPCIDAGDNDYVSSAVDFLNNYRIWDGNNDGDSIVDMGSYEFASLLNGVDPMVDPDLRLSDIILYPNPTQSLINISVDDMIRVDIYNNLGKRVMSSNENNFNISHLNCGFYIVIITTENNKIYTKKIIKY